ncbi:hypothetical protein H310_09669 [Aphanomyces invadans]|uniref:Choline transporter-like protein n=1 Tax=Aphanomyces invadans TaxID=157072 RepID=A0A024TTH8_9STRA|nr:hypothetical protein H310_09669 [Aphanomyces invadans]ETV97329.1 hypothetical protein H310_09669 [Aphanomyces invadans]|eukprot:XP_008874037.1 hypothetical protein H310_09669 [Aphanomyces invadans]
MAREPRTPTATSYESGNAKHECNDVFFLLIFLGVFIMTLVFGVSYGGTLVDITKAKDLSNSSGFKLVLEYAMYAGSLSTLLSISWIVVLIFMGEFMIWFTLVSMILACIVAAIFMTTRLHDLGDKYYWWPAAVFGTAALLLGLYAYCIRNRVKFAAKHLKVAGSALFRLPLVFIVTIAMVGVQLAWGVAWVAGTFGLLNKLGFINVPAACTDNLASTACKVDVKYGGVVGMFFVMLFVFFWGALVVEGIVAVTVAGTVGTWRNNVAAPCITVSAWLRAATLSLGSICFGSLAVAILETIRAFVGMVQYVAKVEGNCVVSCIAGCLQCILSCIQSWMEIFNRYAFTYVGLHGFSFVTAGRHVTDMFASKGWTAIVNDDLAHWVFFLGNLVVGALSAWIGLQFVTVDVAAKVFPGVAKPEYLVVVSAFLIGYIVNSVFMTVMSAAVTTVFVLWAEDPQGWQLTHPDHYARLHAAWLEVYPNEYNDGRGKPQQQSAAV